MYTNDTLPMIIVSEAELAVMEQVLVLELHQRLVVRVSPKPELSSNAVITLDLLKVS